MMCVCVCVYAPSQFAVLVECIEIVSGGPPAEHRNALFVIRHPHSVSLLTNEQWSEVEGSFYGWG